MVRRQTWVLLIVFALLAGAAFYLQKNPLPAGGEATPTVLPTSSALMLDGLQAADIVAIRYVDQANNRSASYALDAQGNWLMTGPNGDQPAEAEVMEEVRAHLASARAQTVLDPSYALDAIGLSAPAEILYVTSRQGQELVIAVGQMTPTGSGYYVRVDQRAPIVVSAGALEGFLGRFREDVLPAFIPEGDQTQPPAVAP